MTMKPSMSIVVLFLELLALAIIDISFSNRNTHLNCIESEREALLRFKQDLKDPSNRLTSWSGDGDCCSWAGVVCDNLTGHVLQLHLQNPGNYSESEAFWRSELGGKINPSLLDLKDLIYLNLSQNYFEGIQIPRFLGSMRKLRYLDLSGAGFSGMIPHQLGNLSYLKYLDLGDGNVLYAENIFWLSGLSLLEHLDLSYVDLNKCSEWLQAINNLFVLKVLKLSWCQLSSFPPLPIANFSSLTVLDLSINQLGDPIPSWMFGLNDLVYLSLNVNFFRAPFPDGLQNLTSLRHFDLSDNYFNSAFPNWLYKLRFLVHLDLSGIKVEVEGRLPRSFGTLCNLKGIFLSDVKLNQSISEVLDIFSGCISEGLQVLDLHRSQLFGHLTNKLGKLKNVVLLDLSDNSIFGSIPLSLGKLLSLEQLNLSYNKLNGTISEIHFANLTRLRSFDASENSIIVKVSPDWHPPFQLETLELRSCLLGPKFPLWLQSQNKLALLDISNSGIVDTIPNGFWTSQWSFLNLSHNQIFGELPNLTNVGGLESLFLNSNNLSGSLPLISSELIGLDLSNNSFSGSISQFLCYRINESKEIKILSFKDNALFGELPDCWMNWHNLLYLNLGNNNFTGDLPTSMGNLSFLQALHLQKNNFSGTIPASLKSINNLMILDISGNQFLAKIPSWIGETFSQMTIFILRSNKFFGVLPMELCRLSFLQVLDLAENNFSGTIPRCVNNFSAMMPIKSPSSNTIMLSSNSTSGNFIEDAFLVMKGKMDEFSTILNLVRILDLSKNNFSGEIPIEVTNLKGLQTLNLSNNFLTGRIPTTIGAMTSAEYIDFSGNQLSGEIPSSISNLSLLSHLNISNNNLMGRIPLSTQLQSFDASSFAGNELCGDPLPKKCTTTTNSMPNHDERGEDGDEREVNWFYVSMPIGFVVGFWGVIGPLLVNRRWRYKYCHFLDFLGNKLYYFVNKC